MASDLSTLLPPVIEIARAAGRVIMDVFEGPSTAERKADGTPVTIADTRAEAIIIPALTELTPNIPVVGEESAAAGQAPIITDGTFWLVDPLDGTRDFIRRSTEFSVNIGLIQDGVPSLGVVHGPVHGLTYAAAGPGTAIETPGAFDAGHAIRGREPPAEGLDALVSRFHRQGNRLSVYLRDYRVRDLVPCSSALKFGLLAAGRADIYPRLGETSEWDTAAGHALVRSVGGEVEALTGGPLKYGKPDYRNEGFFAYARRRPHPLSSSA